MAKPQDTTRSENRVPPLPGDLATRVERIERLLFMLARSPWIDPNAAEVVRVGIAWEPATDGPPATSYITAGPPTQYAEYVDMIERVSRRNTGLRVALEKIIALTQDDTEVGRIAREALFPLVPRT